MQHELRAGEIGEPRGERAPQRVVAVEMEAPLAHRHAGRRDGPRLVGVAVENEAVDACDVGVVALYLAGGGMHLPAAVLRPGGEGLRTRVFAAINLREIAREAGVARSRGAWSAPEFAHGDIRLAALPQLVEGAAVGFGEEVELRLMAELFEIVRVAFGEEVGDGAAVVVEETFRVVGGFHETARQNRQKREDVITAQTAEIVAERVGPILDADFITVDQRTFKGGSRQRPRVFDDDSHHAVPGGFDGLFRHLVAFEAAPVFRRGMVVASGQRVSEADDGPFAGRRVPGELAVGGHEFGNIDDGIFCDDGGGCRAGAAGEIAVRDEIGLALHVLDALPGLEGDLDERHDGVADRDEFELVEPRVPRIETQLVAAVDQRRVADEFFEFHAVVGAVGVEARGEPIGGGQLDADRAGFEGLVELERDGIAFAGLRVARESDGLAAVAVEDVIQMLFALQRGGQLRIGGTEIDAVAGDGRKRQDGDVMVEIHDGCGLGEIDFQPFAAFRVCFGERDGLHGVLLLDPRAAAGRPARAVVEADLHAVRRRAFDGVLDHLEPLRRKRLDIAVRDALPDVQNRETAEARLVHGVDVGLDAFL